MIVSTMTNAEVFQELKRDMEALSKWVEWQDHANRRRALKARRYPTMWWMDYTSPRHIRYIIQVHVQRRRVLSVGAVALRKEAVGYSAYMVGLHRESPVMPIVLTPHMLSRYAQRIGVKKKGVELIRHFFEKNVGGGAILRDNRLAGRSIRYNGKAHRCLLCKEGVMLGDMEEGHYVMRTFITYEMATGRQGQKFARAKDTDELMQTMAGKTGQAFREAVEGGAG